MTVHELQPPLFVSTIPRDAQMLFLAGPIQGAPDWQTEAIGILRKLQAPTSEIYVANPRREYVDSSFDYEAQVSWERSHLRRAARFGAVLFWFAAQDPSISYDKNRSYAQTSRIEFGRVLGWRDYDRSVRLSIGIEPGYKGNERYFRSCAHEEGLSIHDTLQATCSAVMKRLPENTHTLG